MKNATVFYYLRLLPWQELLAEADAINARKNQLEDENDGIVLRIQETKYAQCCLRWSSCQISLTLPTNSLSKPLSHRQLQEEQAPVVQQLEKEIQELTEQINQLNTQQAGLQEEVQRVKKEATEVADSVSSLKFQIQAQTQDCNVLRSQIVQSPERIKREIVHKSENLEKDKGV